MRSSIKSFNDLKNIFKVLANLEIIEDFMDFSKHVWEYFQKDYDSGYSDEHPEVIAKALHRMNIGSAPRIALVGMTSAGKSSLINALFGKPISEVRRTADTTNCILTAEFPSGLLIYDTPGLAGDEKFGYENITRLFLELPQEEDATQFAAVPFQEKPSEIIELSSDQLRQLPKLDAVLFLADISRTLNKYEKTALRGFYLELKSKFEGQVVVAGTHLDELNKLDDQDHQGQLDSYNRIFDNHLIPVSSVSGEGLSELVINLFRIMPQKVAPTKLQESLINTRRLNRLEFVITESSNLLAEIILLKGNQSDDIQAAYLWLFALICKHYSVDQDTWLTCNGDALKIGAKAKEAGIKECKIPRPPSGFWENVQAFFGKEFKKYLVETKQIGVDGLKELLPGVYELLYVCAHINNYKLSKLEIEEKLSLKASELEPLVKQNKVEALAYQIGGILQGFFESDIKDFNLSNNQVASQVEQVGLRVLVHMEEIGDMEFRNGEFAGIRHSYRRLEGFQLNIDPPIPGLDIKYMAHLEDICDTPWVKGGQFIGTRGERRRLEGFAIELTGAVSPNYNIFYMCHLQDIGESPVYSNGHFCGSRGQWSRVEGIKVWVQRK